MLSTANDLARLKVLDVNDRAIELGSLWRDRTAVLVFLRHFGCLHCREHVVQLLGDVEAVRAAGAELYVITQRDQWQQGGTLVVAPSGEVRWHHTSGRPGDNATGVQIVAALR